MDNVTPRSQPPALIRWCGYLAIVCLIVAPLSVFLVRVGLDYSVGLPIFALSGFIAVILMAVLLLAALLPRYRDHRQAALARALVAAPPALVLLALVIGSLGYPPIHDITTDPADPPAFDAGVAYRGDDSNPVDIKPETIAIQKQHYPGLSTIETELSPEQAFERASEVAESMDWVIYNSDPRNGIIEAYYQSFWFGFIDDIVIRIRDTDDGTEVDLRSVSRVGQGDLGANAKRIREFSERFRARS